MIDLNNLIDILPSYYKEYDSYKDSSGKGLLERFLNICGEYLQSENIGNLDSFLENHRVSNIDELYVNNLWEFLGEFPFLQSDNFNYQTFTNIFKGDNLNEAKSKSRVKVNDILKSLWGNNPKYTVRDILPKVISLYKIRGTKKFFNIIFRLYNLTDRVKMVDSYAELTDEGKKHTSEYLYDSSVAIFKHTPVFESTNFDEGQFDEDVKCNTCITRYFEVNTSAIINNTIYNISVYKLVDAIKLLINKFCPFYINPVMVYIGEKAQYLYNFAIRVITPNGTNKLNLIQGSIQDGEYYDNEGNKKSYPTTMPVTNLEIKVDLYGNNPWYLVGYKTKEDIYRINPDRKYSSDDVYKITLPGNYVFIPMDYILQNPGSVSQEVVNGNSSGMLIYKAPEGQEDVIGGYSSVPVEIQVTEQVYTSQNTLYSKHYSESPLIISQIGDIVEYDLIGYLSYNVTTTDANGNKTYNTLTKYLSHNIVCIQAPNGKSIPQGEIQDKSMRFGLGDVGKYVFSLKGTSLRTEINVRASKEYNQFLNALTILVEPSTKFLIRNKDFKPGDKEYSLEEIMNPNAGIKGAYYQDGNVYKPWDMSINITSKTNKGVPVDVKIGNEIVKVDSNGNAKYTFKKSVDIYSIVPYNYAGSYKPLTISIIAKDDPVSVIPNLISWNISPYGEQNIDELSSIEFTAYANIQVSPSEREFEYQPGILFLNTSTVPFMEALKNATFGEGIPQNSKGQAIILEDGTIGRLFQMNYHSSSKYSCIADFDNIPSKYNGDWCTVIVKSVDDLTVLGSIFNLKVNQKFKLNIKSYTHVDFGFFKVPSNKNIWSNLLGDENSDKASKDVYVKGTATWNDTNPVVEIVPFLASIRYPDGDQNLYQWSSPYILEIEDSEGNYIPFIEWQNYVQEDSSISESSYIVEYPFPLHGSPKKINFKGTNIDGSIDNLFEITLDFPEHQPTISSNIPSQEFPAGTNNTNIILTATSNRLKGPWDIFVNGDNKGKTNADGSISLNLPVPGDYHIYANMIEDDPEENPSIDLQFTVES